jgi:hypothetical protein
MDKRINNRPPSWLGKKHSEETRRKMSLAQKGRKAPWNIIRNKDPLFWTKERRLKASKSGKKKPLNLKALAITHQKNKGQKRTLKQRENISRSLRGNVSSFWKGGVTAKHKKIRVSAKYKDWRLKVFKRDNHTCRKCGKRGGYLQAHHVKHFSRFPKLRFTISNGITLCLKHHKQIHEKRS